MTLSDLRTDLVIVTCAISAGIHGALVEDHFEESTGAGVGFVVATVLLVVLAVVLTCRRTQLALLTTVLVLAGLIVAYVGVIVSGVPVLHPEPEPVDGLALFTKAVEGLGLILAASLLNRPSLTLSLTQPKGTPT